MQTIDLLASIRIADTECRILGGEISAQIEAEDSDTALVTPNQLLRDLSLKEINLHSSHDISPEHHKNLYLASPRSRNYQSNDL